MKPLTDKHVHAVTGHFRPTAAISRKTTGRALILGAIVVGSLDIAYALGFWALRGAPPTRIFQSIAAGMLGRSAFSGGLATAALGALLHYLISLAVVTIFWIAGRWWDALFRHPVLWGALYGVMVYGVMNYVVIPLSGSGRPRFLLSWVVCSILVHAFLIGVPAALFARAAALGLGFRSMAPSRA